MVYPDNAVVSSQVYLGGAPSRLFKNNQHDRGSAVQEREAVAALIRRAQDGAVTAAFSSGSRPCCTANSAAAARLEAPILA